MATKLERLARALVTALEANDASGWMDERTDKAWRELSDFLDYLASPEVRRGSPELMERRPSVIEQVHDLIRPVVEDNARVLQDMVDRELHRRRTGTEAPDGYGQAIRDAAADAEVILPSPRESEAPPIEMPVILPTDYEGRCELVDMLAEEALVTPEQASELKQLAAQAEPFEPAEQETKP